MSPSIEIYYFPILGRSAPLYAILDYAGADWAPKYVKDWDLEKANTPFHRVPVLYEKLPSGDTFVLPEAHAIERYFAKRFNLYGDDMRRDALQDAYVSQWNDAFDSVTNLHFEDEAYKDYHTKKFNHAMDLIIKTHGEIWQASPTGLYFGNKIYWVDIVAYTYYQVFSALGLTKDFTDRLGGLDKLKATLDKDPRFQSYIEKEKLRSANYKD
ncbi:hypothetical protein H4R34_002427 [Dimargaris verticillata]|uniref:Glutathione S-transferase n=1 Tax=Dimargaris verticillata TaxID=2761393 RepID=A0A9W8B465_9FUNG|nr:hypothetical protein H4R34_002427 [Dimargaris verticillata]